MIDYNNVIKQKNNIYLNLFLSKYYKRMLVIVNLFSFFFFLKLTTTTPKSIYINKLKINFSIYSFLKQLKNYF